MAEDTGFFIGQNIRHKVFGEGTVVEAGNGTTTVRFNAGEKKLAFSAYLDGKFAEFIDPDIQKQINEMCTAADRRKEEQEKTDAAVKREREIIKELKLNEGENAVWLQFQGQQNRNNFSQLRMIQHENKTLYFVNFSEKNRPYMVREDDVFFTVETFVENAVPVNVVTGRGHFKAFSEKNYALKEWEKIYSDFGSHPYYLILKDFEILNAPIKYGVRLNSVIASCGKDTFVSGRINEKPAQELLVFQKQKLIVRITVAAKNYINAEFERIAGELGSSICYSST